MSGALVTETEIREAALPERAISEHPNFVTARGLWLIEDSIQQLTQAQQAARSANDETSLAHIGRDLRYWQQRLSSAQLVTPATSSSKVCFGATVQLESTQGRQWKCTLVGEDEAEPSEGYISWVSPEAQTLLGHPVGDEVTLPIGKVKIIALSTPR